MELQDQIVCAGVIVGNVLTAAALFSTVYFNNKGRRDPIREHIYKEQFTCYMDYCKKVIKLSSYLIDYSICHDEKDAIDIDQISRLQPKIDKQFKSIEDIEASSAALFSPQIEQQMKNLSYQMSEYYNSLMQEAEIDEDEILNAQEKTYNQLIHLIRQELRITEHITENYQLYSSERKAREKTKKK